MNLIKESSMCVGDDTGEFPKSVPFRTRLDAIYCSWATKASAFYPVHITRYIHMVYKWRLFLGKGQKSTSFRSKCKSTRKGGRKKKLSHQKIVSSMSKTGELLYSFMPVVPFCRSNKTKWFQNILSATKLNNICGRNGQDVETNSWERGGHQRPVWTQDAYIGGVLYSMLCPSWPPTLNISTPCWFGMVVTSDQTRKRLNSRRSDRTSAFQYFHRADEKMLTCPVKAPRVCRLTLGYSVAGAADIANWICSVYITTHIGLL